MPLIAKQLIQVAGVIDDDEARLLEDCGVRYLGFPLRLPVHREDLSEEHAARIIKGLQPPCHGVLITYLTDARDISDFCKQLGARIVQLHADIESAQLDSLKQIDPGLAIIKSLVVGLHDEAALSATVESLAPRVDAFITDTYDPKTGASGATGRTHDWAVSRRLVELSSKPVILAGGLSPGNVREAIEAVRPAGVDVHTGVEDASGRKDRAKVMRFVRDAATGFDRVD